jgi:hypothetical protein
LKHSDSKAIEFPTSKLYTRCIMASRVLLCIGTSHLIAGSCLLGNRKDASDVSLGLKFTKAVYGLITVTVGIIAATTAILYVIRRESSQVSSMNVRTCSHGVIHED